MAVEIFGSDETWVLRPKLLERERGGGLSCNSDEGMYTTRLKTTDKDKESGPRVSQHFR